MAHIEDTLLLALSSDPAVLALVGDRIYPGEIPDEEAPAPWVYYAVPNSTPFETLARVDSIRHTIEFHALADRYTDARAVIDAVIDVVNGMRSAGVITYSAWADRTQDTTEDGYHHSVQCTVDQPVTPPFTPLDLPGLMGWWSTGPQWCFTDAAAATPAGDTDPIRVRVERSGTGLDFTQATTAARPTLRLSGSRWVGRNDGVDDTMQLATATCQPTAAGLCVVWVGTVNNDIVQMVARYGAFAPQWSLARKFGLAQFTAQLGAGFADGVVAAAALPNGTRAVVIAQYDRTAGKVSISVNRAAPTEVASALGWWFPVSSEPIELGDVDGGFNPLDGDVETLILCAPLSAGDRSSLLTYLGVP